MHVLVTGGIGFIGSHVVEQLVERGHLVRLLDRDEPHDPVPAEVEVVHGDITDPATVETSLDGIDAICHQAAMVGLGVDFDDVERYVRDNDLGTAVMLRALHRRAFAGPVVVASSMVVYGEGRYRCATDGVVRPGPRAVTDLDSHRFEPPCPQCGAPLAADAVPEDAPLDPRNVYAATKLHTEHLAFAFAREHSACRVVALRYHNVYGPRMPRDTPYAGVASLFRSALERGELPQVFEDGGQIRDFVHVTDIARANVAALEHDTATGAFNVASGTPHTVGDMAAALCKAFGADPPVVTGAYRLGDVRHVFASPALARRELGFTAQVDFETGMQEFATAPLRRP